MSIVERYIQTGEPVGSKVVYELLENSPSASTIRNEMASLTAMGFLEQPHVSAGRVPSVDGYRIYINNMVYGAISQDEKNKILSMFSGNLFDPESVLREACSILSQITDCTVVFAPPPVKCSFIKEVKFIKIGKYTSMIVLITSSGMVQNQIFNCDFEISDDVLHAFERCVNNEFVNSNLNDLSSNMNKIISSYNGENIIMETAFRASFSALEKICKNRIGIEGKKNLFQFSEVSRAFEILNFIESDEFDDFIFASLSKIKVYLGDDSNIDVFSRYSVTVERYRVSDMSEGAICVIGPIRMDYSNVIGKLNYVVEIVQKMLSKILNL